MTDLVTTIKEAEELVVRRKHAGHSDQSIHTPKRYLGAALPTASNYGAAANKARAAANKVWAAKGKTKKQKFAKSKLCGKAAAAHDEAGSLAASKSDIKFHADEAVMFENAERQLIDAAYKM